jgi:hypothetical protein
LLVIILNRAGAVTIDFEIKFDNFTVVITAWFSITSKNPKEKMNKASSIELRLHFSVMERGQLAFQDLFDAYSAHLLSCLFRWYKSSLYADATLAHEAVYAALKYYCDHPRSFNPEHGTLQKFLEIAADKHMQRILEREKHQLLLNSADRVLNRYFDNDLDIQLAKMILKNEQDFAAYISLLGIGSYRIAHQQTEIKRLTERVRKTLEQSNLFEKLAKGRKNSIGRSKSVAE